MPTDLKPMLRVGLAGLILASSAAADSTVHVGIHRHLHQPIYWGEPVPSRPDQSQFGRDSQDLKEANQAYYGDTIQHPENQLIGGNNSVFENPDKQQAYQNNTFAYQAHRAQYIDPNTGAQQTIIAVPQCDYHGYQSGFGAVGWSFIDDKITTYHDPNQPSLVMLTNDGENFWGGGNSFWNEFAPHFMNDAPNHGKKATTIQQFLDDHTVPANDIIHVEDSSWLAADQGSPQFYRWLEPPRTVNPAAIDWSDATTIFDIENGWHSDMRNWAVMLAGVNYCETAEQITGSNNVLAWRIEEPYQDNGTSNNPNAAEKAWHFLMWGFDSGFVYFGDSLDDEVKHTFAANRAISIAAPVVGDTSLDATPPTVFKPQRFPWNPGGKGKGQYLGGLTTGGGAVGFSTAPWPSDFYVWTMAFDVSGLSNVTLKVRSDADGVNPLNDTANETYAGGSGVGNWVSIPMAVRAMPKDDPTNSSGLNFFVLPDYISDYCWAKVEGYRDALLDYYIEAVDNKGHVHKSEIQHVYVEDDGAAPTAVSFSADPRDCAPLTVTYDSTQRPLAAESPVFVQIRFDQGANWNRFAMSNEGAGVWSYAAMVPTNAPSATVWFENAAGTVVDSNDGANWSMGIRDCLGPYDPVICAAPGSPQISMPPITNQNHPGDQFDFNSLGGAATTSDQTGFGSFGQVYINFDDTNLYIGAHGADLAGDNNAMILFLDVDTLSDDKQNLWSNRGNPRGLDNLHNVQFVTPMDIAILLGSENGDVTSMTGPLSSGFAFGQGVFRLAPADFPPVAGARISQFDGVDRYLSGNYLGASATGVLDGFHNFGFSFVQLTGLPVCLPHLDDDMDGLSNGYELRYWQNAGRAQPGDNHDGDAFSNLEEQALGTNPTNRASTFILFDLDSGVAQNQITWSSVGGRTYAVEFTDDLEDVAFAEIDRVSETDVAIGVETTEVFIDDFTQTGASSAGHRTYRVRLVIAP